jgi:hypothetical protein
VRVTLPSGLPAGVSSTILRTSSVWASHPLQLLSVGEVALLLGVLVRGEHVAGLSVLGGVVCLAGAWLMRRAQMEHAVPSPFPALQPVVKG